MSSEQETIQEKETVLNEVVVVGSSAGSVEALSILVSNLPADFPAPIVLAQHLDPTRPSHLAAILQRRAALPVEIVTEKSKLERGKIYVVPSNHHVVLSDGFVSLEEDHKGRPRPSVDLLLSTAAATYGDRLIAVILTGSGSDGAAGAVEVKNAGGVIIVQNPQTARYPSMPMALPPTIVDFEANIEQIGTLIYQLLTGETISPSIDDTERLLNNILEQVGRQASIDFRLYKISTLLRRVSRRMTITHTHSMQDYALYLETHPEEIGELVQAFLINVTQFFRDPEAFNFLKTEVLPKIIARARQRDRVLRLWSAGCATGEEPYSLAMLLVDLLGSELPEWSIKIFATDLDDAAITFARRGFYTENFLKNVPVQYQEQFFERVEFGFRVTKALRQMVIFGQQDLSRSAPFPRIDLVMCRNVLIYFTPELQDYVLNQFAFSLSDVGYLFLGKAETVRPAQPYFDIVNKQWKVYICSSNTVPAIRRQATMSFANSRAANGTARLNRAISRVNNNEEALTPPVELNQLRRVNELLLRYLPVGLLMIDRNYRLLTSNGVARRLLGLREMANEQDFLHSVRGIPYPQVRAAIDSVFRERAIVTLPEIELDPAQGGNGRFVSLSISLMQIEGGVADLAAISVSDVTEQVETRRQLEIVQTEQTKLMGELNQSNRRLNDLNKELTDANEELQVSNEELETNNEELQATNEELQATNDELRARTSDLQEAANLMESERVRLAEMVGSSPFHILLLRGPDLLIEAYNPRYIFMLQARTVIGLPIAQVTELFLEATTMMVDLARDVYYKDITQTSTPVPARLSDETGETTIHNFVYTIVPSHDARGKVMGVVVYGSDQGD